MKRFLYQNTQISRWKSEVQGKGFQEFESKITLYGYLKKAESNETAHIACHNYKLESGVVLEGTYSYDGYFEETEDHFNRKDIAIYFK